MIHVGDNTWNLRIFITDLQVEKTLRVRGDMHIGGVMLRLVDPGWWLKQFCDIFLWLFSCHLTIFGLIACVFSIVWKTLVVADLCTYLVKQQNTTDNFNSSWRREVIILSNSCTHYVRHKQIALLVRRKLRFPIISIISSPHDCRMYRILCTKKFVIYFNFDLVQTFKAFTDCYFLRFFL